VKVHYDEGLATHIGPEPCAGLREGIGEASVGERIGQPLSRERYFSRMLTLFQRRKAIRADAIVRASVRSGVVGDPGMYGRSLHGNREISQSAIRISERVVRSGKARSRSR
jgi:hypothetical protein